MDVNYYKLKRFLTKKLSHRLQLLLLALQLEAMTSIDFRS